jgi:A/G-specific adenine glycosylase
MDSLKPGLSSCPNLISFSRAPILARLVSRAARRNSAGHVAVSPLSSTLLKWYAENKRRLPWRGATNPYRIWISEIMLQQTRAETVVSYYRRWLQRFPTVEALARATEKAVLQQWEGLGYYARARNLRRSARIIVSRYAGRLPSDKDTLRELPGIGEYTAAAIASIAFGQDEVSLDGNVRRVLARLFAVGERLDTAQGRGRLYALARMHMPHGRAGDFNQALMDLGATVCLPRIPHCRLCPVAPHCQARRQQGQLRFPKTLPKPPIPHRRLGAAVLTRRGRFLLVRRPPDGLLGGLWEFPNAEWKGRAAVRGALDSQFVTALANRYGINVLRGSRIGTVRHTYSHFRVTVHALACVSRAVRQGDSFRWVRLGDLARYPMGRVDRQIADLVQGGAVPA